MLTLFKNGPGLILDKKLLSNLLITKLDKHINEKKSDQKRIFLTIFRFLRTLKYGTVV